MMRWLLCLALAGAVAPGVLAADGSSTALLPARAISVTGNTVLPDHAVREVTARYADRPLTLVDVERLRIELSELYHRAGYVNSGFVVPDQPLDGGRLVLHAIEGSLSRIEVTGAPRLREQYVKQRILRHVNTPLNVEDLQYALRWLQMDSNIARLDAELLPGDAPGESVLRLAVAEPSVAAIELGVDNHSSASVGSEVLRLTTSFRNMTGFGEVIRLSAGISDGIDEFYGSVTAPVNRWNTTVSAYYSISDARIVEERFKSLDITSEIETLGLAVSHPVLETLDQRLAVGLAVENKQSREELLGVPFSFSPGAENGEAEITAVQASLDWSRQYSIGVLSLRSAYRHGLDVFGSTRFAPRSAAAAQLNPTGTDGEFRLLVSQGVGVFQLNRFGGLGTLNERARLIVRATAQFADDPLMSMEKLSVGGANSVRGFRENTYVRDNGVVLSLEAQLPFPGYRADPNPLNFVAAVFTDYGSAWDDTNISPGTGGRDTSERRYLASAGIGILWEPTEALRAALYWGHSIASNFEGDDPSELETLEDNLQDDGVHFSFTYRPSLNSWPFGRGNRP